MVLPFLSGLVATKAVQSALSRTVDDLLDKAVARRHPRRSMSLKAMGAVPAGILGAAAMYFLDPAAGSERRASVAQRVRSMMASSNQVTKKASHLQSVSKGAAISTLHRVRPGQRSEPVVDHNAQTVEEILDIRESADEQVDMRETTDHSQN